MNYINRESFRCLIGPMAKNVQIIDNLFIWIVNNKNHFVVEGELSDKNIEMLKSYTPCNFYYIDQENLNKLKDNFKISKTKNTSITIDIRDLNFVGKQYSSIRNCLNKCKNKKFELRSDFKSIDDVKTLINNWSNNYTDKYFRDNSGKNYYFYKQNYHENLISLFVYDGDRLISFGTLSNKFDESASYIIGKALYKDYPGLSEFTDIELYKVAREKNIKYIHMGNAKKGLLDYKTKFEHIKTTDYNGIINEI